MVLCIFILKAKRLRSTSLDYTETENLDWNILFRLQEFLYISFWCCLFSSTINRCRDIWLLDIHMFKNMGKTWHIARWHSWWRHQMETFSALLAFCAGNSPVTGEFPAQRPVTRSFDVFFDLCLKKHRFSKQSWGWWFETLSRSLGRQCNYADVLWCELLLTRDRKKRVKVCFVVTSYRVWLNSIMNFYLYIYIYIYIYIHTYIYTVSVPLDFTRLINFTKIHGQPPLWNSERLVYIYTNLPIALWLSTWLWIVV